MGAERENLPQPSLLTSLRLLSVVDENQCWNWTAALTSGSSRPHLKFNLETKTVDAHYLISQDAVHGKVQRSCGNSLCVNPDHMTIERPAELNKGKRIKEDVKDEIFKLYQGGGWSQNGLAFKFGLSAITVYELIKARRKTQDAPSTD